jgi:hypothetical protein
MADYFRNKIFNLIRNIDTDLVIINIMIFKHIF